MKKVLKIYFLQGLWNFSPPSVPSETMTAKTRFAKATFKQPGMYDIEVRAGKTFRFEILFSSKLAMICIPLDTTSGALESQSLT